MKLFSPATLFRLAITVLALSPTVHAGQVVMDFDALPAPGANNTINSPYTEDGLRLTNSSHFYLFGPGSNRNTGHKALSIQFTNTLNTLTAVSGAPFTLVSMRLSPLTANATATVTFTGNLAGGGTTTASFSTGAALAGVVRTFPNTFTNLTSVTWTMDSTGAQYHQFDDITAILKPEILVSPSLTVTESSGSVTVGVMLSEALAAPLSMQWNAANGTALATTDYASGGQVGSTFVIPAGQRLWSTAIDLVNDTTVESLETFTVSFSTASTSAVFPGNQNTTTIRIASEDGVTGFPGWMSAHGLTAAAASPNADPNGDGVSNIESWLCKINPAGPSPQAWLERRTTFLFDGSSRPALRFTVPSPLPSDVGIAFEETTSLSTPWSAQASRSGFGVGSLWSGTGSSRVAESSTASARTITCSGSQTRTQRPKAFLRMKFSYVTGGGST